MLFSFAICYDIFMAKKESREHMRIVSFSINEFLGQHMTILKMHHATFHLAFLLLIRTTGCLKSWNDLGWMGP